MALMPPAELHLRRGLTFSNACREQQFRLGRADFATKLLLDLCVRFRLGIIVRGDVSRWRRHVAPSHKRADLRRVA